MVTPLSQDTQNPYLCFDNQIFEIYYIIVTDLTALILLLSKHTWLKHTEMSYLSLILYQACFWYPFMCASKILTMHNDRQDIIKYWIDFGAPMHDLRVKCLADICVITSLGNDIWDKPDNTQNAYQFSWVMNISLPKITWFYSNIEFTRRHI